MDQNIKDNGLMIKLMDMEDWFMQMETFILAIL